MNDKNASLDPKQQVTEKRLSHINIFYSAFGNFLTGLFCIAQYFLTGTPFLGYITAAILAIIFIPTYYFSHAKMSVKNESLWDYFTSCANIIGELNPIFLALGIYFSINACLEYTIIWIVMEVGQIILYIIAFKKHYPNWGNKLYTAVFKWLKTNIAFIITVLLSITFFVLWYINPQENRYADLWLNLSASFIASSITIAVIDRIIKKQKEQNEKPLRSAMYRDIQLFTSRFVSLWQEMYLHSVEDRVNMSAEELFCTDTINIIRGHLDLSCNANVLPKQTWFSHIENSRKDLVERGEKILSMYSGVAEPEAIQAIHHIITDNTLLGRLKLIALIHGHDTVNHIPRPTILASYTSDPADADSIMISQLFSWCRKQYNLLHEAKQDNAVDLFPIPDTLNLGDAKCNPSSAITAEKLNSMIQRFDEWSKKQSEGNSTT